MHTPWSRIPVTFADASNRQQAANKRTKGADTIITAIRTAVLTQGLQLNHVETIVRTPLVMQGFKVNHAETIVWTPLVMGSSQHVPYAL